MGCHLSPRLFTGTEKSKDFGISAGKVFARDSASGTDPHSGNVMIIHERQNLTGVHVEQHNETDIITRINTPFTTGDLDFFREAGVNAQRHGFDPWNQPHDVVEIVLSTLFFPWGSQPGAWRIHGDSLAELAKRLFDRSDFFRHGKEVVHLIVFEK